MSKKAKDSGAPNIRKKAVALRYDRAQEDAPRITATGKGLVAERIIQTARSHGIAIHEDKDLVELLSKIELYEVIPVELYQVIAEVLAFVYHLNKEAFDVDDNLTRGTGAGETSKRV